MKLNINNFSRYLIKTDNLYTPEKIEGNVYIEVKDAKIKHLAFDKPDENIEMLDLTGDIVSPGFIDVHIHGYGGHDTMEGTIEAISSIAKGLATKGVTSFLSTTRAAPVTEIEKIISVSPQLDSIAGAKPLGFHLEGPFLSKQEPGAMNPNFFEDASIEKISALLNAGRVIMITIAPEIADNLDVIEFLVSKGVRVSLGHTATDYETAVKALAKGATSITHFFNAIKPFQHRAPGLIGGGIVYPFYLQFIADGVHTHKATIQIMSKLFKDRLVLISDSNMAAGLDKPGKYERLGGFTIFVDEISARLENGTLAGSILTMDRGVRNLMEFGNLTLSESLKCASTNPAESIDIKDRGSIKKDNFADFVVLDKNTLQVVATIREGKMIYAKEN